MQYKYHRERCLLIILLSYDDTLLLTLAIYVKMKEFFCKPVRPFSVGYFVKTKTEEKQRDLRI